MACLWASIRGFAFGSWLIEIGRDLCVTSHGRDAVLELSLVLAPSRACFSSSAPPKWQMAQPIASRSRRQQSAARRRP